MSQPKFFNSSGEDSTVESSDTGTRETQKGSEKAVGETVHVIPTPKRPVFLLKRAILEFENLSEVSMSQPFWFILGSHFG